MAKKPFTRYEYKLFEFQGGCMYSEEMVQALNKIGVQGWKLVRGPSASSMVTMQGGPWYVAIFVREKA